MARQDDISIDMFGLQELLNGLDELGSEQGKAIARANAAAAKDVLIPQIMREAPSDRGNLSMRNAWKLSSRVWMKHGKIETKVGANPKFSERVVRRHRKTGMMRSVYLTPSRYLHAIQLGTKHIRANPFLTRAFRAARPEMERVFVQSLGPAIEKTWKQIARRAAKAKAKKRAS